MAKRPVPEINTNPLADRFRIGREDDDPPKPAAAAPVTAPFQADPQPGSATPLPTPNEGDKPAPEPPSSDTPTHERVSGSSRKSNRASARASKHESTKRRKPGRPRAGKRQGTITVQLDTLAGGAEHPDVETIGVNMRLPKYMADALRAQATSEGRRTGVVVVDALRHVIPSELEEHFYAKACQRLGIPNDRLESSDEDWDDDWDDS